ncbi:MAG: hypothetical protein U1F77_12545 [Kiritimatiellia bacterium]
MRSSVSAGPPRRAASTGWERASSVSRRSTSSRASRGQRRIAGSASHPAQHLPGLVQSGFVADEGGQASDGTSERSPSFQAGQRAVAGERVNGVRAGGSSTAAAPAASPLLQQLRALAVEPGPRASAMRASAMAALPRRAGRSCAEG